MADKKLTSIAGGATKPPTSLNFAITSASVATQKTTVVIDYGAQVTATITSATLTEVLNIPGSGYFTFAAVLNDSPNTVTDPKFRIVIDGTTTLDESSGTTIADQNQIGIIGRFASLSSGATESRIEFNSSFIVSIAGDGTDGVAFAYKRVLT